MKKLISLIGMMALLLAQTMQAQDLTGTILKDGKPQKNVSVWLKIGRASAVTDKAGHFALSGVVPDDTLQISVSSKYDAKIVVGELKDITINLGKESFSVSGNLDEVTVPYSPVPQMKRGSAITHDVIMRSGLKTVSDVIRRFVPGAQEMASYGGEKVLEGISENTTRVRNTKAFLLAALFNSVSTLDNHYTLLFNHNTHGG